MSFHFIFVANFIRDKNPLYGIPHTAKFLTVEKSDKFDEWPTIQSFHF